MNNRGTFTVLRSVFDHPALSGDEFNKVSAWLWLVSEAAWDNRTVTVARRVIDLSRGQLAYSLRYLAEKWKWEHKRVDRFLARLRNEGLIRTETESGITVVTIVEYDRRGAPEGAGQQRDSDGTANGTANGTATGTDRNSTNTDAADTFANGDLFSGTGSGTAIATPLGEGLSENRDKTYKQINKRKNICSPKEPSADRWPPDAFDIFYDCYPRKRSPKAAKKAFQKVRVSGEITFAELIARAKRYAEETKSTDSTFIAYPATWLNAGSYLDAGDAASTNKGGLNTAELRDPKTFTTADWATRMARFAKKGEWNPYWGPAPGRPGCLVPGSLIDGIRDNKNRNVA